VEAKIAIPLACVFWAASVSWAQQTPAERLIEAGHWKRARAIVEARIREAPDDPLAYLLLSQIRNAFGDHTAPLQLAEKTVAIDGRTAKYHRSSSPKCWESRRSMPT
jgi:predicted Zn-dependent protease